MPWIDKTGRDGQSAAGSEKGSDARVGWTVGTTLNRDEETLIDMVKLAFLADGLIVGPVEHPS